MSLSPNDVRSYEFSSKMRGYDKEEVDNFLEQVAQTLESVKQESVKLSMELDNMRSQNTNLKQNEDIIKSAAIDARRNADQTINQAKKDALAVIQKAKEEAEKIVGKKTQKIQQIDQQIKRIEQNRKNYLGKLRTLISSHLDLVEKEAEIEAREVLSTEPEITDSDPATGETPHDITVTDSEDVTSEKREILAEVPDDDKTDVPEELRSTVIEEDSVVEDAKVEEGDSELADALRKYNQVKEAHPPYLKDEDEDKPEPIPSLASPNKKWVETTARAEEPPPEFIARKPESQEAAAPEEQAQPDSGGVEPNPIPADEVSDTDRNMQAQKSGRIDVEKEFDEIAARFNEEMDKAENQD